MEKSRLNTLSIGNNELAELEELLTGNDTGREAEAQLKDRGIFYLLGPISDQSCLPLHYALLLYTQVKPPKNGITIVINSAGGDLQTAWALIDLLDLIKPWLTVRTLAIGEASSAASLILAAGSKGHRYVGQNCCITLHDASYLLSDLPYKSSDILSITKDLKLEHDRLIRFWTQATETSDVKQITETFLSQADAPINAEQAVELKIADFVTTSLIEPFQTKKTRNKR